MTSLLLRLFVKDHQNTKDPKVRASIGKLAGKVSMAANVVLALLKILAGFLFLGGSVSVIADGVNNLSDSASGFLSLLGFKLAEKPADEEHPYGHGRYEYLSGLMVALMIMVIGIELLMSSIEKIFSPSPVTFSIPAMAILVFSILSKLWLMYFNKKLSRMIVSDALKATAADNRNDVISTSAVLLAGIVSPLINFNLDGYVGVLVALFILYSGFGIVKDTIDPLLGRSPSPERVAEIKELIRSYDGVLGIHDVMIHDYGPGRQFASVHVELSSDTDVLQGHDLIDRIERELYARLGLHLVVHYDPVCISDERLNAFSQWIKQEIQSIHPELEIHDLRMVPCEGHTNVIFDCVLPYKMKLSEKQVKDQLIFQIGKHYPDYLPVINMEHSFVGHKH
jgi:cation diffusion facilitator family transporter